MIWVILATAFIVGLGFLVGGIVEASTSDSKKERDKIPNLDYSQKGEFEKLNIPYKCECGIVSRYYQLEKDSTICSHCGFDYLTYEDTVWLIRFNTAYPNYKVPDDRKFPFAPKLELSQFLELAHQKEEMKRIKKEMEDLVEYDKEVEAWEQLQHRRLKEFEIKAEKIKSELKQQKG